jgi:hypothetical protein
MRLRPRGDRGRLVCDVAVRAAQGRQLAGGVEHGIRRGTGVPRHAIEQADEEHGGGKIEGDMKLGRELGIVGLPGLQMLSDRTQEWRDQQDADKPVEQVAERTPSMIASAGAKPTRPSVAKELAIRPVAVLSPNDSGSIFSLADCRATGC